MKIRFNTIQALVLKDLKVHRWPWLYYLASSVGFPVLIFVGIVQIANNARDKGALHPFPLLPLTMLTTLLFPLLLGQWLIGAEKTKRTLFLNRILPISPGEIAVAKTVTAVLMTCGVALVTLLVTSFFIHMRPEFASRSPGLTGGTVLVLLMLAFIEGCLFLQVLLDGRLAFQIPFAAVLILRPLWGLLQHRVRVLSGAGYHLAGLLTLGVLLAAVALLQIGFSQIIGRTDWSRPTNE